MIPLYKLEKLPRSQKLRKIAKIFSMAENRLFTALEKNSSENGENGSMPFGISDFVFFSDTAKMLAKDALFSEDARKVLGQAAAFFEQAAVSGVVPVNAPAGEGTALGTFTAQIRRALNGVKHLLLAETGRDQADWDFTVGDGRLDPEKRRVFEGMQVYLEDIRSPFNVGAMFRTADCFGVEKIFLSPFCADPNHRRAQRTAMGCTDVVPWERRDFFGEEETPAPPCPVFALETGGVPLDEFPFPRHGLLIAGCEELGVSPRALAAADASLGRVSIPCYGAKASLNVSVAFGIALSAWVKAYVQ
jgi:TrmH family RNA methyltransferase